MTVYDAELFAGPGGWDVAARLLGAHPVGLEWDEHACATAISAGFVRVKLDVALANPWQLFGSFIRLLIGSPPCQAFSAAGKGKGRAGAPIILEGVRRIGEGEDPEAVCKWVDAQMEDDRAALVLEPLRWAIALRPETICLEQVPAVLPLWEAMAKVLETRGYSVWCGNLQAERYDTGQTRKRAIMIASRVIRVAEPVPVRRKYRKGTSQAEAHKLDTPGLKPWISMKQALGHGLNKRPSYTVLAGGAETGGAEPFANGARKGMRAAQDAGNWIQRSNYNGPPTHDGSARERTRRSLDEPSSVVTSKLGHWQSEDAVYRPGVRDRSTSRSVDLPAPTVLFGNDAASVAWTTARPSTTVQGDPRIGPPGHKHMGPDCCKTSRDAGGLKQSQFAGETVRVTVQEAAILQGFPADYPWHGNKGQQHRQVGDAMPPPLAWHVLRAAFGLPVQHYPGTENL